MNDLTDNYIQAQTEKRNRIRDYAKRMIYVTFQREGIHH